VASRTWDVTAGTNLVINPDGSGHVMLVWLLRRRQV